VQHKDAKTVDASVLLMPLVDFIGPRDPRWLSTLRAVGERLAFDTLVRRYRVDEIDLCPVDSSHEGSFNACSFWYIACLARSGFKDEAWLLFSKMIGYSNHLGLYAEETGGDGRQLGNFPQALTHLALINAVFALEEAERVERATTR
jgi:GH15 family glucan-1,4-alpha-glucosidase